MKRNVTLIITSLLSILLFSFHFADDIVRGIEEGDLFDFTGVLILAAWLYATLVLAERRSGLVIILLFSIGAAGIPLIHMRGAGLVGGAIANSSGVFFWVWTLIALGATGIVSVILAAQGLWSLRKSQSR
ncbi:MAG: hypothetical protein H0W18_13200 [Acidobacteria bacterium]|nr:hypothetical protein [Acidobacteriota bacterium]